MLFFSLASGMVQGMAVSVGQSPTFVQPEISQQLLNGLPLNCPQRMNQIHFGDPLVFLLVQLAVIFHLLYHV